MYTVEYLVYNTPKTKTFDTYAAAKKFFYFLVKQSWSKKAELIVR